MIRPDRPITPSMTKTEKRIITKKSEKNVRDKESTKEYIKKNLKISMSNRLRRRLLEKRRNKINKENQNR